MVSVDIEYTGLLTLEYDPLFRSHCVKSAGEPPSGEDYRDFANAWKARAELVKKYAWAIPSEEALQTIAKYSPLVEIGAGTGYWAYELRRRGVEIHAYDRYPPNGEEWSEEDETRSRLEDWDPGKNWFHRGHPTWTEVLPGTPDVLKGYGPEWNLFLCWPPMDEMAAYALGYHRGKYVVYVGEGEHGCNANRLFFKLLNRFYEPVETVSIPQWFGLHDRLVVYKHRTR